MEQWKLPELHQSVGYRLQAPGGIFLKQSTGVTHAPVPATTLPIASCNESITSDIKARHRSRVEILENNYLRKIKKNHKIIKSRFQSRLDEQERKNSALSARLEQLKQCDSFLTSLQEIESKITVAESFGTWLKMDIQKYESAVARYGLEGPLKGGEEKEEEQDEEEDEEEYEEESDGENSEVVEEEGDSEEDEKKGSENSEEDSDEEADSECNCADEEDD
ncbi:hypothetical protein QBC32DRAFT_372589 [Pseudoneurospora amorphoporcata]|uniref:Uncharacterized protein n=1 Tax=Pseudoneurospora amorphoporcata TaxID=241081 RepID=A0AAN6NRD5_9PEZI|nr:hypothetical protein QBC32DRAFT_372589 [Pseudoneurospora amorphoporcata]